MVQCNPREFWPHYILGLSYTGKIEVTKADDEWFRAIHERF